MLRGQFPFGEKMDTCKYPWRFEFTGIIPKEKSKVLTVRDVKRQSEQRKENHKTRREDFSPGQLWCHHVAIETALSFLIRVNWEEGVDILLKKKEKKSNTCQIFRFAVKLIASFAEWRLICISLLFTFILSAFFYYSLFIVMPYLETALYTECS